MPRFKGARKIFSVLLALLSVAVTAVFWQEQILLSALLILIGICLMLVNWHKRLPYIYALACVGGPLAEIVAMQAGAWSYADPAFLGAPVWLPFLWGNAALFIARWRSDSSA